MPSGSRPEDLVALPIGCCLPQAAEVVKVQRGSDTTAYVCACKGVHNAYCAIHADQRSYHPVIRRDAWNGDYTKVTQLVLGLLGALMCENWL